MTNKNALFLTGTDTDVGKTTFAAALCYAIVKAGFTPQYYKPVLSGALLQNGALVGGDLTFVQETADLSTSQLSCSYLFEPAVSPHLAAHLTGQHIEHERLIEDFETAAAQSNHLVIEGAGGAACPLGDQDPIYTMAHLMASFQVPCLIACHAQLGTLHHTAATVAYMRNFNLPIAGLLVNHYEDTLLCKDNLKMLTRMTGLPVLAILPKLENCDPESLREAVDTHWDTAALVRRLFP